MQTVERVLLVDGDLMARLEAEAAQRAQRLSHVLQQSALRVLGGTGHGRIYRVSALGGAVYQASAPGEPPAERTGALRSSWRPLVSGYVKETADGFSMEAGIVSEGVPYIAFMDPALPGYQPSRIAPRPFVGPILEDAQPAIDAVLSEPWLGGPLA